MKKYIGLILIFTFVSLGEGTALAQDTFDEWKEKQKQEFQDFRDARDKEFMKMLDDTWKAINAIKAKDFYEEPKPVDIPEVEKPTVRENRPDHEPVVEDVSIPDFNIDFDSQRPIEIPESPATVEGYKKSKIDFYTLAVPYSYPEEFNIEMGSKIDKKSISNFWGTLGSANYEPILEQSLELKNRLTLNDWGYASFLYRMGKDIYGRNANESVLFTWFMMTKAGYQAKVGYDQDYVYLLLPADNQLFNTKFFRIDGLTHYAVKLDNTSATPSSIFTYDGTYPEANKKMDLNIDSHPRINKSLIEKNLAFKYNNEQYEIPVQVNRNVVAFYELYPVTDLDIYFSASISPEAKSTLLSSLAPVIKGKSETESVNILLRFVQTAFSYQTDQEQFGHEKYLLPEETLFYPYSDCEDRSILFSMLVKELTGLDVVGIRYPGHLAAAVKFSNPPEGDFVMAKGEKYTIADPTYVNANIGMTMPQYRGQEPEIVE